MNTSAKARIIKIGNSQGVRIPKFLLDQLALGDQVELVIEQDQLIIRPAHRPRQGWEEQFARMAAGGDDRLLDPDTSLTHWDQDEWEWE